MLLEYLLIPYHRYPLGNHMHHCSLFIIQLDHLSELILHQCPCLKQVTVLMNYCILQMHRSKHLFFVQCHKKKRRIAIENIHSIRFIAELQEVEFAICCIKPKLPQVLLSTRRRIVITLNGAVDCSCKSTGKATIMHRSNSNISHIVAVNITKKELVLLIAAGECKHPPEALQMLSNHHWRCRIC